MFNKDQSSDVKKSPASKSSQKASSQKASPSSKSNAHQHKNVPFAPKNSPVKTDDLKIEKNDSMQCQPSLSGHEEETKKQVKDSSNKKVEDSYFCPDQASVLLETPVQNYPAVDQSLPEPGYLSDPSMNQQQQGENHLVPIAQKESEEQKTAHFHNSGDKDVSAISLDQSSVILEQPTDQKEQPKQTLYFNLVDILAKLKQLLAEKGSQNVQGEIKIHTVSEMQEMSQEISSYRDQILALVINSMSDQAKIELVKSIVGPEIVPSFTKNKFEEIGRSLDYFKTVGLKEVINKEDERQSQRKRDLKAEFKDKIQTTLTGKTVRRKSDDKQDTKFETGAWKEDEIQRLFYAVRTYGKDYKKIQEHIGTRDRAAIGSFTQQLRKRVQKDSSLPYADVAKILSENMQTGHGRKIKY